MASRAMAWKDQPFFRDPVLSFAMASSFCSGAVFNLLPTTFPVFREQFGASFEQMGRTQLLFFMSALLVSISVGWLVAHLGPRLAAAASALGIAAGLFAMSVATTFDFVLAASFLFGFSVSALIVVSNAIVSDHFGAQRQSAFSLSGIFDAFGAILGPALLGWWLGRTSSTGSAWRGGYVVAGGGLICLAIWAFWLHGIDATERKSGPSGSFAELKFVIKKPAIYGVGLALCLHSIAQIGMISWIGQYVSKTHEIGPAKAAYFISVNSAGFFLGRALLTWIGRHWYLPELVVIAVSALGATLAFFSTLESHSYLGALGCFAVAGFFISGDGPAINSLTGVRFPGSAATAFAVLFGFGNIGAAFGPYLTGLIGTRFGLEVGIWLIPVFSLLLSGLAFSWWITGARRPIK